MRTIVIVLLLLAAVGVGLAANHVSGAAKEATEAVQSVLGATTLLAAFIVALVLAGTSESYSAASADAKEEADVVDNLFESAEYADQPYRQALQASAVCYARAVVGPDWETMAATGKRSPVPRNWTSTGRYGLRKTLIEMGEGAKGFGLVQSADQRRSELRNDRLIQANPTVPGVLFGLMVLLIAITLGGLAYSIPREKNRAHIVAVVVVTLLFVGTVLLIDNLDRPFSGLLAQRPTAMQETADEGAPAFIERYGDKLPCNARGEPLPS